jgi:hypothetical protein
MADQADVDDEELTRLRRRAYSREGTHDDRERLAELEAAKTVTVAAEAGGGIGENATPDDERSEDHPGESPHEKLDGRGRWLSQLGIIALLAAPALLIAGFIGFGLGVSATSEQVVHLLQQQTDSGVPGLRWFDREDAGGEPLAFDVEELTGLEDPLVRDVAAVPDSAMADPWRVLVTRGANEFGEVKVCLISSNLGVEKTACSTEDEFIRGRGLALGVGNLIVGWLPSTDMLLIAPL